MGWRQKDNMALGTGFNTDLSSRCSPETRDTARRVLIDVAHDEEDLDTLISMLGLYIDDRDIRAGFGIELPKYVDGELRTKYKTYPPPTD